MQFDSQLMADSVTEHNTLHSREKFRPVVSTKGGYLSNFSLCAAMLPREHIQLLDILLQTHPESSYTANVQLRKK